MSPRAAVAATSGGAAGGPARKQASGGAGNVAQGRGTVSSQASSRGLTVR